MDLSLNELRIIGALVEKSITTPDQYPLSLNALTNACNQKSNREPVLNLSEGEIHETLDTLTTKHLVSEQRIGNRTAKYQHRFCNTEFSEYHFNPKELGILCVMFLRGPQTPGELRSRTIRLCEFTGVDDVEAILERLNTREEGPFVEKLEREPGRRENRYRHLFGDANVKEAALTITANAAIEQSTKTSKLEDRVERLETYVEELKAQVASLTATLNEVL